MTVELRCPFCNAQGMAQMGAKDAGLFLIVHCKTCGAVHGIVPKPPAPAQPQINVRPVEHAEPAPEVEPAPVDPAPESVAPEEQPAEGEEEFYLSPEKARLLNMFHSPQVSTNRRKVVYKPGKY